MKMEEAKSLKADIEPKNVAAQVAAVREKAEGELAAEEQENMAHTNAVQDKHEAERKGITNNEAKTLGLRLISMGKSTIYTLTAVKFRP